MDPDMNKYDLNHRVSHHPKMSDRGMGGGLSGGLGGLLHAGAHAHDPAPLRGLQARPAGHDADDDPVVLPDDPVRGRASARRRRLAPEVPARPPARHAAREPVACSIRAMAARPSCKLWRYWWVYRRCKAHARRGAGGARPLDLQRPRDRAAARPTSSRRSISITPPAAARPRWRASAATTPFVQAHTRPPSGLPPSARRSSVIRVPGECSEGAAISVRSLSPFGERVGVRGLPAIEGL